MPAWTVVYEAAFWPLLLILVVACWRYGEAAVRATATVLAVGMWATWLLESSLRNHAFETGQAIADAAMLIAFVWLATRWPQRWLMVIAAMQVLVIAGHLAKLLGLEMTAMAYAILHGSAGYPQLAILSIGLLLAIRTRRSATVHSATASRDATTKGTD